MGVFVVWKWVAKAEKLKEHNLWMQKYLKWIKEPPISKEVKSIKIYTQTFGGIYGSYVELIEFDNLAGWEKVQARLLKDEEYLEILQEFLQVIEPAELCIEVWKDVM